MKLFKSAILIGALFVSACSDKDKNSAAGCTPNANLKMVMYDETRTSALSADNKILVYNDQVVRESRQAFIVLKSNLKSYPLVEEREQVENAEKEEPTIIDFASDRVYDSEMNLSFTEDKVLSEKLNKNSYQFNTEELKSKVLAEIKATPVEHMQVCSVETATWKFTPDLAKNTVEMFGEFNIAVQLSAEALRQYE